MTGSIASPALGEVSRQPVRFWTAAAVVRPTLGAAIGFFFLAMGAFELVTGHFRWALLPWAAVAGLGLAVLALSAPWKGPLRWLPLPAGLVLAALGHVALVGSDTHVLLVVQTGHADREVMAQAQFAFAPAALPQTPGVGVAVLKTERGDAWLSAGCDAEAGAYIAGLPTVSFVVLEGCEVRVFANEWIV